MLKENGHRRKSKNFETLIYKEISRKRTSQSIEKEEEQLYNEDKIDEFTEVWLEETFNKFRIG